MFATLSLVGLGRKSTANIRDVCHTCLAHSSNTVSRCKGCLCADTIMLLWPNGCGKHLGCLPHFASHPRARHARQTSPTVCHTPVCAPATHPPPAAPARAANITYSLPHPSFAPATHPHGAVSNSSCRVLFPWVERLRAVPARPSDRCMGAIGFLIWLISASSSGLSRSRALRKEPRLHAVLAPITSTRVTMSP